MTKEMANDAAELKKLLQVGPLEFKGCSGLYAHKLGLILDYVATRAADEPTVDYRAIVKRLLKDADQSDYLMSSPAGLAWQAARDALRIT